MKLLKIAWMRRNVYSHTYMELAKHRFYSTQRPIDFISVTLTVVPDSKNDT